MLPIWRIERQLRFAAPGAAPSIWNLAAGDGFVARPLRERDRRFGSLRRAGRVRGAARPHGQGPRHSHRPPSRRSQAPRSELPHPARAGWRLPAAHLALRPVGHLVPPIIHAFITQRLVFLAVVCDTGKHSDDDDQDHGHQQELHACIVCPSAEHTRDRARTAHLRVGGRRARCALRLDQGGGT